MHDVVAEQIHELRSTENKEFKTFTRQLQNDYDRWTTEGTHLLVASDLTKVDIYQERLERLPNYGELENFIARSRMNVQEMRRKEKRERDILRGITAVAIMCFIVTSIAGRLAIKNSEEADKQKIVAQNKAIEAQQQLRKALISERNRLNDSLNILMQEMTVFGKAQEDSFVRNRFNQFNSTWFSIMRLTANIQDSIQLHDGFKDDFKPSVSLEEAQKKRQTALESLK